VRLVAAAAAVAVLLCGCSAPAGSIDAIKRVTYSQQQDSPGFDEGAYVLQGEDLEPLLDAMREYDIDPATYGGAAAPCPNAVTSEVTIEFRNSTPGNSFTIVDCGEHMNFELEATVVMLNYAAGAQERENGYGAVTFTQSQALPGFDDGEQYQNDPAEIARLVALLGRYDIEPDGYVSPETPGCTGGIQSTVRLWDTDDLNPRPVAFLRLATCGATDGFDAEATALLSGWREAQAG
jgi:hypothetical protein